MPILRLLILVLSTGMTVIALVIGVVVMLGIGWLVVAAPVLVVIGLIAVGRALWRRYGRAPDSSQE
ncbi:MAG TPA: hypothetical protein VIE37_04995 [Methylomirabilota bacterium]|jgi:hypothetical protein